jgi:transcriptional regulator with XRE-family HTH domain
MQHAGRQIHPSPGPEKAFGQALREFRRARSISQEALGFESGFDRTYISLLERGVQSPTLRTVVKLADVLKVSPSEMIQRMELIWAELASQPKGKRPSAADSENASGKRRPAQK